MKAPTQDERISAAKYFGIHRWNNLRQNALRLALALCQVHPELIEWDRVRAITSRFKVASAFDFYFSRPDFYYAA